MKQNEGHESSVWYPLELAFLACVAVALNLAGALLGKLIALSLASRWLSTVLFIALCFVYLLRTVYWVVVGRRWQLSFLYPVLSVSYFVSFLIGIVFLKEEFAWNRLVGAFVIVAGVLVISTSTHRHVVGDS